MKGRINLKPLLPQGGDREIAKALAVVEEQILSSLKTMILQQGTFSPAVKKRLVDAIKVRRDPSSVTFYSDDPVFHSLVTGVKKQPMHWLVGAAAPIPIITDSGELIFRVATAKSLASGGWVHPGRAPLGIIAKARKHARELIRETLVNEIRSQIKKRDK